MRLLICILLCAAAAAGAERFLIGDEAERVYEPFYGGGGYEAVRLMEVIRLTDGLVAGEITRWEWFGAELDDPTGKFDDFRIRLCHTSRSELIPPYNSNYEGRSPTQVFYADPATVTMPVRHWFGFDLSPTFQYDGTNNLLVEVWWEGDDNGGGRVFAAYVVEQLRSLSSSIKNGVPQDGYPDEGLQYYWLHYMRVTLTPDAVAPTSIGRVKAMYR